MKKNNTISRNRIKNQLTAWLSVMVLFTAGLSGAGAAAPKGVQAAVTLHNPVYDSDVQEVEPGTEGSADNIHNPVYSADTDETIWDCVWFGNYWQSDTNGDGVADKNDEKEPIKWRVLSVDGDDVFLLADKNLDVKPYNTDYIDVTWETCTLRSWLNGYGSSANVCGTDYTYDNFIDAAFSENEQEIIQTTTVINDDNLYHGTEGGNNTTDKVCLLSLSESSNPAYGFNSEFVKDSQTRIALNTAYAAEYEGKNGSMDAVGKANGWWLRTLGMDSGDATYIDSDGYGHGYGSSVAYVRDGGNAVRPTLHLPLSSLSLLSYAGTVPSYVGGNVTWDCVYFGNYWQSDTNGDKVADVNDAKKPIKWRVLSAGKDDVFLLADANLDAKPYNEEDTTVTWETCTLRSWLNGYGGSANVCGTDYTSNNFIDAAFSVNEQTAIKTTTVINDDNPDFGTEGGNNTTDKVFLLSISEVSNSAYGFNGELDEELYYPLVALNTAYAKKQGVYTHINIGSGAWWLRSPGNFSSSAASVSVGGYSGNSGYEVDDDIHAVRPALHLPLSSLTLLNYAGTVCSDGTVTDADGNVVAAPTSKPTPTVKPTMIPTAEPTPDGTAKPTVKPSEKTSPTKKPGTGDVKNIPATGQVVKDAGSKAFYQMVSTGTQGTVSFLHPESKLKKVKVPAVIYYEGKKYKVTSIVSNSFAGNKKLTSVVIGENVKTIGKKAFANCKKLSKVTVKSKVLSKVAKNAFKGTNKKLTVKVPKSKRAKYKKLFQNKGNKKLRVK